jgi:hypothetical protein
MTTFEVWMDAVFNHLLEQSEICRDLWINREINFLIQEAEKTKQGWESFIADIRMRMRDETIAHQK